ncbi:MAG: radical SAM protein, partial [Thermoanaerobaculia bacterium]
MKPTSADRRIRDLRPAKQPVDAWRPLEVLVEEERTLDRGVQPSITVFLAGRECPFTCVFCDLWRQTLDGPTPAGA